VQRLSTSPFGIENFESSWPARSSLEAAFSFTAKQAGVIEDLFRLMRDEMTIEHELISIERTLWTNDAAIYEATYLPDAVLIFPVVGKIGRASAVAAIREENAANRRWAEVDFSAVSLLLVAPDVALLNYEATARWNYEEVATKVGFFFMTLPKVRSALCQASCRSRRALTWLSLHV
jgi:hypothetical protein